MSRSGTIGLVLACAVMAFSVRVAEAQSFEKVQDGIVVHIGADGSDRGGVLKLDVIADDIIRVLFAKDPAFFSRKSLAAAPLKRQSVQWTAQQTGNTIVLSTPKLQARIDLPGGNVTFLDAAGNQILAERARAITPAEVQGEQTQHLQQTWQAIPGQSLFGLGQHQLGIVDIAGYDIDLWQRNTTVIIPLLVSNDGYGIFWDNTSFSRFGDLRDFEPVPADELIDVDGRAGGLTTGTFNAAAPDELQNPSATANLTLGSAARGRGRAGPRSTRWIGQIAPTVSGAYQFRTYSNGGIKVWIDNKLVIDHWRQNWLTEYDQVKIRLEAGKRYPVRIESGGDQTTTMQFRWKTPAPSIDTSLWSEVGDGIDYYFIYGPRIDRIVAGYRQITGQASLLPVWAFGLWQSRQRYETSQQLMDALDGFRSRKIPFDNIVQDWQYWPRDAWGSHQFDPQRFPHPDEWIRQIHEKHAHLMISVWGKFYPGNDNFEAMNKAGYLYQQNLKDNLKDWIGFPYTAYDAFNAGARKMFWDQVNKALFSKGVDAWWMDATEPDLTPSPPTLEGQRKYMNPTAMGTASRMINAYALVNSQGVYEGQREAAPNQRVFILTRSGFAGIQRYGTVTWSGDITSTWTAMAKQIAAGLGYSISGAPWWTMDIGGYTMESRFSARNVTPENAEEWRELNARWFEFGTFSPLLRVHGELQPREMWTLGGESHPAYQAELKFDKLRYAMLPYIYSVAGDVAMNSGTMMRPFVMDYTADEKARGIADEYMFGPAFLVAPVTTYKARSRSVYLPEAPMWYDFWTGTSQRGGQSIDAPAPYDSMPLYIKAGSIIPFGPELQYTTEKSADPTTLYVYQGTNGAFTIYEDQGTTYDYERGAFSRIPLSWNEAGKTLTIGKREGSFPGMLSQRTFNIIFISKDAPVGFAFDAKPAKTVQYSGDPIEIRN